MGCVCVCVCFVPLTYRGTEEKMYLPLYALPGINVSSNYSATSS